MLLYVKAIDIDNKMLHCCYTLYFGNTTTTPVIPLRITTLYFINTRVFHTVSPVLLHFVVQHLIPLSGLGAWQTKPRPQSPMSTLVTADVTLLPATTGIKMALRPGSGGGGRYFNPFKINFVSINTACPRGSHVPRPASVPLSGRRRPGGGRWWLFPSLAGCVGMRWLVVRCHS